MRTSAQLREQEQPFDPALLLAGVDVWPESIAVLESGRILYANHAFGKANGFVSNSELRGRLLTDLLPRGTRFVDARESSFNRANAIVHMDASISDFQESQRAFQLVCIRPVTQANHHDAPPAQSQKLEDIDRSLPGIAHDFGNLLTGILLYSDLLVEGLDEGSRLRRHAEAIRSAGTNGVTLIQQLTNPSPESPAAIQPASVNQVISGIASLLTRLVGETIEIRTNLAEAAGLVKMDAGKVHQIILNLTINARYALPNGGKITLSTRNCTQRIANSEKKLTRPIPCVEFSVTDTGCGMDKKTLAQVFRPFFTTRPRSQGQGLGLTMVQGLVKQAGGEVEIESEPGKGTRVTIRIPRVDVPDETN
jgi:signal transduction histidine kinase